MGRWNKREKCDDNRRVCGGQCRWGQDVGENGGYMSRQEESGEEKGGERWRSGKSRRISGRVLAAQRRDHWRFLSSVGSFRSSSRTFSCEFFVRSSPVHAARPSSPVVKSSFHQRHIEHRVANISFAVFLFSVLTFSLSFFFRGSVFSLWVVRRCWSGRSRARNIEKKEDFSRLERN